MAAILAVWVNFTAVRTSLAAMTGQCTNGVPAHRVIEHAVAGTDAAVKHVSRLFPRTAGQLTRPDDQGPGESGPA